jgi:protein-S-isoprenylcysteine O-methyltransferase Ste14
MSKPRALSSAWCFEHRVEIAGLIGGIGFVFYVCMPLSLARAAAPFLQKDPDEFVRRVYWLLALLNVLASALRIWAGGTLGGARMMAVNVQTDALLTAGPYGHVRNPIYLADILTLAGMGLVVPWPGALLVWLLLRLAYPRIIAHEEANLRAAFGARYDEYAHHVDRLDWSFKAWRGERRGGAFSWREGLTNNFIYLPLVPGFVVCALTGALWHGVAVGAAGPVGWIALHFWRNYNRGGLARRGDANGAAV